MAAIYIPPPGEDHLLSQVIEWVARHFRVKVSVTVTRRDGSNYTEEYDARSIAGEVKP